MVRLLVVGLFSFVAFSTAAIAQPVVFVDPPQPTTADEIHLIIGGLPGCSQHIVATRVLGQSIEIDVAGFQSICVTVPPPRAALRLLIPGAYTVRAIYDGPEGIVVGPPTTFEVTLAPEHIPAVRPQLLFALVCTLLVVGLAMLNRQ